MVKSSIYRQILIAVIANISSISIGLTMGWTSPIVPKLRDVTLKDTPLDRILTANEVGWIGSLVPIGGAISPFFSGTMADKFGRKSVILLNGFILLASFLILGSAQHIVFIFAARLMHGLCVGLVMTVMPMYIGEIAQVSIRGALGTFMILFVNTGILSSYCVGPFVPYETFQYICLAFPILALLLLPFMPETPTYYLLHEQKDKAIKSLMFLSKATTEEEVRPDLDLIQRAIKENHDGSWKELFESRGSIRALGICCGLLGIVQLSGIYAVDYYAQTIFTRAGTSLAPEYASIILQIVPFVVGWCVPFAVERFGRKTNLLISAIGGGFGLAVLSIYFFLEEKDPTIVEYETFLPILSLIMYTTCFNIGYGPIPWAIMGELFTPHIKAHGTIIGSTVSSLSAAIVLQFFETLNELIGPFWVFGLFTLSNVFTVLFVHFVVIETKGLTLLEIQEKLNTA